MFGKQDDFGKHVELKDESDNLDELKDELGR